ncbi:hypothetical protein KV205_13080 [Streptomyces sp. SKN60]|uniref:hypothetical protein n=1 Tax=Streptomyces sp. SKN60 TaxID=2855506 RepID=UPI002246873A|nr:hypothetical protein [Streptomyces sp. SKN60]MCX2181456.1 hypothetical protein [Streptomyces sp. SKN60]
MDSSLVEAWMRGIASNSGAPADVLVRLLDPGASTAWKTLCQERALPDAVTEAVLTHPRREVRRAFARNGHMAPELRGRLVRDPDALVRAALAGGPVPPRERTEPLPDEVVDVLLTARDEEGAAGAVTAEEIKQELLSSRQVSPGHVRAMATHPDPALRAVATDDWAALTAERRAALLADPDPAVRDRAHRNARLLDPAATAADPPERDGHHRTGLLVDHVLARTVVDACLGAGRDLRALAHHPDTPADAVARLARDPDPGVRERVASRADLDPALLPALAEDPDERVRTRARVQPYQRTWARRAAVDRVARGTADSIGPLPRTAPDPDWYAECARSEHALLRRVAATCAGLPADLAARLADDPDPDVRHLLAHHHPLAPAATLLAAFLATPRRRRHLLTLPRMPRTGLGHLLDHEDPEVRALAAADPTLDRPPVPQLGDPDARVRRAAAANPVLPGSLLSALLEDPAAPELAEGAAANPRLTAAELHALLDRCGLPGSPAAHGTAGHHPLAEDAIAAREITEAWRRVTDWLGRHAPDSRAALRAGARPAGIDAVESELGGVRLPAALRALWTLTAGDDGAAAGTGARVGCLPGGMALIPLDAVAAAYRSLSGTPGWRPAWLPVISLGPADRTSGLFLDTGTGHLGRWTRHGADVDEDTPDSLGSYLEETADTLEHPALATGARPGLLGGTVVWESGTGSAAEASTMRDGR